MRKCRRANSVVRARTFEIEPLRAAFISLQLELHPRTRSTSKQASTREKEKNSQEPLLTIFNVSVFPLLFFQLLHSEDSEIKFDNNKVEFSREGVASQDDVVKHSLELQQTSTHIYSRSVSFPNGSQAPAPRWMAYSPSVLRE